MKSKYTFAMGVCWHAINYFKMGQNKSNITSYSHSFIISLNCVSWTVGGDKGHSISYYASSLFLFVLVLWVLNELLPARTWCLHVLVVKCQRSLCCSAASKMNKYCVGKLTFSSFLCINSTSGLSWTKVSVYVRVSVCACSPSPCCGAVWEARSWPGWVPHEWAACWPWLGWLVCAALRTR